MIYAISLNAKAVVLAALVFPFAGGLKAAPDETPLSRLVAGVSKLTSVFGGVQTVSFRASHVLDHLLPDGTVDPKRPGYERSIKGTLSADGMFRIEIRYTKGAAVGTKYLVSFDGMRTYLVASQKSKSYLVTKKGKVEPIPYLFHAVSLLEPFAFLKPAVLDPNDLGSYLALDDLTDKKMLQEWASEAVVVSNSDTPGVTNIKKKIKLPDDRELVLHMFFQTLTSAPTRIDSMVGSNRESREFSRKEVRLPDGNSISVATAITINQVHPDKTKTRMVTTIHDVAFPSKPSTELWKYDLNQATTIFDGDENVLVPSGVK